MNFPFSVIMGALLAGNSTPSVPSFYFNFSNPSNVTLGAAQARGTITSTQNAVISASVSPSRTTGVAPLYVNFDATGTTSTLSANPSHELFFAHDFGDAGAGTWANGVQSSGLTSKNAGYGPVTGHVYETPGTYTVQMVVTDGVNTATKTGTIVVLDPNVVYDPAYDSAVNGYGHETICLSHSGNYTGAPGVSGNPGVSTRPTITGNTDMYALFNTYKGSNKRILFCKADSWVSSAPVSAAGLSNMIIGGYGTGVAHSFASGTLVSVTPAVGISAMFYGANASDVRFSEFLINANGAMARAVGNNAQDGYQITLHKIEVRGAYAGFDFEPGLAFNVLRQHKQLCFYECSNKDVYGYAGLTTDTPRVTGATATNASPCVFTSTGHPFNRFNKVRLSGTAPTGFNTSTDYFISGTNLTANTFSLSASVTVDTPLASSSTATCDVTAQSLGGGVALFVGITNGGIMGCHFDNGNYGEQVVRLPYFSKAHINNNYIARPNQGKNIIKIHTRLYANIVGVPGVTGYSEHMCIFGNFLDLRGGYSNGEAIPNNGQLATGVGDCAIIVGFGNGGEGGDGGEYCRNIIVESNYTQNTLGQPKSTCTFVYANCPNFTVRNNIADFSMGTDRAAAYTATYANTFISMVGVATSTLDPTTSVRIYNNTLYSNMVNAEAADFVQINAPTGKTSTGAIGTPGVFTSSTSHGFSVNQRVRLIGPGTIPAPLVVNTDYWISATSFTTTTFVLKDAVGGTDLALSGTGTCEVTKYTQVNDVKIHNNLWYLKFHNPANLKRTAYRLQNTTGTFPTNVTATYNTDSVAGGDATTSPNFAVQPPVALADWKPIPTSYAISSGTTVPVLRDFNNITRVGGTYDLGAVLP